MLTSPFTPMLFMGEEWGAGTPWQYFTDHTDPRLAEAVRQGRRREFAGHGWRAEQVPDPQSPDTVAASTLDWAEPKRTPHAELLSWYRELIRLRRDAPELSDGDLAAVRVRYDAAAGWLAVHRGRYRVLVRLGGSAQPLTVPLEGGFAALEAAFGEVAVGGAATGGAAAGPGGAVLLGPDAVAVVRTA